MATEQEKATMNEATNAMMSAGMMLEELTTWNTKLVATIAERDAEIERLRAALVEINSFNHLRNDLQAYLYYLAQHALGETEDKPSRANYGIA